MTPPPDFDAKARMIWQSIREGCSSAIVLDALREAHDAAVQQCIAHAVHVRDVVYAESPEHAIGAGTVVRVIEREMKR